MAFTINGLIELLNTSGYREGRRHMLALIESGSTELSLVRRAAADVVSKGRLPGHMIGSGMDDAYSMAETQRAAEAAAAAESSDVSDAAHAFCVLAGNYDAQVLAGRPTITVSGEMPALTAAAHQYRLAQLTAAASQA